MHPPVHLAPSSGRMVPGLAIYAPCLVLEVPDVASLTAGLGWIVLVRLADGLWRGQPAAADLSPAPFIL